MPEETWRCPSGGSRHVLPGQEEMGTGGPGWHPGRRPGEPSARRASLPLTWAGPGARRAGAAGRRPTKPALQDTSGVNQEGAGREQPPAPTPGPGLTLRDPEAGE